MLLAIVLTIIEIIIIINSMATACLVSLDLSHRLITGEGFMVGDIWA